MARPKTIDVPLSERENFIHGIAELQGLFGMSYETLKKNVLDRGLKPWRICGGKEFYRMRDVMAFMENCCYDADGNIGKLA